MVVSLIKHRLWTKTDSKYSHLVMGGCTGCRWVYAGSSAQWIVAWSFDSDHGRSA